MLWAPASSTTIGSTASSTTSTTPSVSAIATIASAATSATSATSCAALRAAAFFDGADLDLLYRRAVAAPWLPPPRRRRAPPSAQEVIERWRSQLLRATWEAWRGQHVEKRLADSLRYSATLRQAEARARQRVQLEHALGTRLSRLAPAEAAERLVAETARLASVATAAARRPPPTAEQRKQQQRWRRQALEERVLEENAVAVAAYASARKLGERERQQRDAERLRILQEMRDALQAASSGEAQTLDVGTLVLALRESAKVGGWIDVPGWMALQEETRRAKAKLKAARQAQDVHLSAYHRRLNQLNLFGAVVEAYRERRRRRLLRAAQLEAYHASIASAPPDRQARQAPTRAAQSRPRRRIGGAAALGFDRDTN